MRAKFSLNALTAFAVFTAIAAATAFFACVQDDRTAGVDEFPNSIYARVNTFLDEGKKSEAISPVPAQSDSLLGNPGFHVGAGKVGIGKLSAAEAGAENSALHGLAKGAAAGVDSGCNAGVVTVTDTVKAPLKVTVNIASVCFDAKALDTIKGNETILHAKSVTTYNTGRVETAEIGDADGDGILNPKNPSAKANITFTALEKGVLEKTVLVVGPGPDANFDTEKDNLVYSANWIKASGSDTLGYAHYTDADSDGVAIDNGKASVVDLDFYAKGPSKDHPDAVWSRARMRMVVRYQVEAKEVRRVRFDMQDQAGRTETGEVLSADGGADFSMQDRVQAHFLTVGPAADTLDSMDVHLTMSLGKDFDAKTDDSIFTIDVRTVKKSGDERVAHFAFDSSKPIPSGQDPQAGSLTMSVAYADGTALEVAGDLSPNGVDVTVKDRAGKRSHVVWDREGRGLTLEKLK